MEQLQEESLFENSKDEICLLKEQFTIILISGESRGTKRSL